LAQSKAELLSLQQVRCFCAALELGSFTAAAAALRVSQPAVAEQIRKLERALGSDLFVRAGRGVVPTPAGRAFAEHAARALRALEEAAGTVGELDALTRGTLAIGVFGEPSAWRLDELAAAFLRRHPELSLRLVGPNSAAIADRVRRGELDAGVVLLPVDDDGLEVRPLVRDEVLYVSASPERTRRPVTVERLAAAPLVFYDAESADADPIRRQLAERAQARGLRLEPKVEVEL
jgi:DNA-binding transcriptional LysR family regulator